MRLCMLYAASKCRVSVYGWTEGNSSLVTDVPYTVYKYTHSHAQLTLVYILLLYMFTQSSCTCITLYSIVYLTIRLLSVQTYKYL